MATIATMAMLKPTKSLTTTNPNPNPRTTLAKPCISLLSLQNPPKGMALSTPSPAAATAMAGAFFSALSSADAALAAQKIAEIAAEGDNRGLALLLPIVPAVLWVLYNILQPALNQLSRMRSEKALVVGLGLGLGLGAGLVSAPSASAEEVAAIAAADAGDNRGLLLLFVVAPAIAWVLYNILPPALNQLNRMRSG